MHWIHYLKKQKALLCYPPICLLRDDKCIVKNTAEMNQNHSMQVQGCTVNSVSKLNLTTEQSQNWFCHRNSNFQMSSSYLRWSNNTCYYHTTCLHEILSDPQMPSNSSLGSVSGVIRPHGKNSAHIPSNSLPIKDLIFSRIKSLVIFPDKSWPSSAMSFA